MYLFPCLTVLFLIGVSDVWLSPIVVNDMEPYKCDKRLCRCDKSANPICASTSRTKKDLKTYINYCLFLCDAKCLETTISFFHCGQCDPKRNFTAIGEKGKVEDFACLEFNARPASE